MTLNPAYTKVKVKHDDEHAIFERTSQFLSNDLIYLENRGWMTYSDALSRWVGGGQSLFDHGVNSPHSRILRALKMVETEAISEMDNPSEDYPSIVKLREKLRSRAILSKMADPLKSHLWMEEEDWLYRTRMGIIPCTDGYNIMWSKGDIFLEEASPANRSHIVSGIESCLVDLELVDKIARSSNGQELLNHMAGSRYADFLVESHPDLDTIYYMWLQVGAALLGAPPSEFGDKITISVGKGANGKTVEWRTIKSVFGDFFGDGPTDVLTSREIKAVNSLWNFTGNRILFFSELPDKNWNQQTVKKLTSGESIMIDKKYVDQFNWINRAHIFAHANLKPRTSSNEDKGFWRRIDVINYPNVRPEGKRDTSLQDGFIQAGVDVPLIYAFYLAGATSYLRGRRSQVPEEMVQARLDYERENDIFAEWAEEFLDFDPELSCPLLSLYESFEAYAHDSNMRNYPSKREFAKQFNNSFSQVERLKSSSVHFRGVGLKGNP